MDQSTAVVAAAAVTSAGGIIVSVIGLYATRRVSKQVHTNGGSSMRDAINRTETAATEARDNAAAALEEAKAARSESKKATARIDRVSKDIGNLTTRFDDHVDGR